MGIKHSIWFQMSLENV